MKKRRKGYKLYGKSHVHQGDLLLLAIIIAAVLVAFAVVKGT